MICRIISKNILKNALDYHGIIVLLGKAGTHNSFKYHKKIVGAAASAVFLWRSFVKQGFGEVTTGSAAPQCRS